MALSSSTPADEFLHDVRYSGKTAMRPIPRAGEVSWGSIATGAAAAASLSLILLILGVGLGLSSATTFGESTILWLTFTQLLASAMGGYVVDRLRAN